MEKHLLLLAVCVLVCKLFWEGTHFMCRVLYRALILRADALETRGIYLLPSNQYLGMIYLVIYIPANGPAWILSPIVCLFVSKGVGFRTLVDAKINGYSYSSYKMV